MATSLDRNLNGCGLDEYIESSPVTDTDYAPAREAPDWDYRVVYEVWVDLRVFGDAGFGSVLIEHVHASPSKEQDNTVDVVPRDCDTDTGPDTETGHDTDTDGDSYHSNPPGAGTDTNEEPVV